MSAVPQELPALKSDPMSQGLAMLAGVANLSNLSVRNNCHISGEGVGVLSRLDSLAFLDLRGAQGMHPQAALRSLQVRFLYGNIQGGV